MDLMRTTSVVLGSAVLAACVTINVYFPAAQAQEAADQVIEDVWGDETMQPASTDDRNGTAALSLPGRFAYAVLELVVPSAQAAANIEVNSPAVRQIVVRMERRFDSLRPFVESGAVGLTNDAMMVVRDLNAVPLPQRNQVRQLVADENTDRAALYQEIARANSHTEWEDEIRSTFAARWVANARPGWWYQNRSGQWVQR